MGTEGIATYNRGKVSVHFGMMIPRVIVFMALP